MFSFLDFVLSLNRLPELAGCLLTCPWAPVGVEPTHSRKQCGALHEL